MQGWNLQKAASTLNVALLIIYGILFLQLRQRLTEGYSDFVSFYTAGRILERGIPERLYDLKLQYEIQRETAPNVQIRQAALPFVRPAFEAWIFWPLAHLRYGTAFRIWNLLSCICLIAAVLILRQEIPGLQRVSRSLLVASALCYFPVFFTLVHGQDSLVLLLIYVLAFRALHRDRQFLGGLTLGLGVFKFPLVVPFLIPFALKSKLRVILGFALMAVSLSAVSITTVGLSAAVYYPKYLLNIDALARGVNRAQDMPNLRGFLDLVLPTILSPRSRMLLLLFLSVLLLGYVVRKSCFNPSGHRFPLVIALNVCVTVLVSYHCHAFDLCVLLLPIGLAAGFSLSSETIDPKGRKRLIWIISLAMFSPFYLLATYTLNTPSLLAGLLLGVCFAIGMTISELPRSLHTEIGEEAAT